jgi:hypothetical protein
LKLLFSFMNIDVLLVDLLHMRVRWPLADVLEKFQEFFIVALNFTFDLKNG